MRIALLVLITCSTTWSAPLDFKPVDQAVGDLDPMATSLRRLEPGLSIYGQQTSLYQHGTAAEFLSSGTAAPVYYRIGPGFCARFDRPDYLVPVGRGDLGRNISPRFDGEFRELIPANTVFDLTPTPPIPHLSAFGLLPDPSAIPAPNLIDARVKSRMEWRLPDNRVETRLDLSYPITPVAW